MLIRPKLQFIEQTEKVFIKFEGDEIENKAAASISNVKDEGTEAYPTLFRSDTEGTEAHPTLITEAHPTLFNTDTTLLLCDNCKSGMNCYWEDDLPRFKELVKDMSGRSEETDCASPTPRNIRYAMYRSYAAIHHPGLRKGQRIRIPTCVVQKIHEEWPNVDGVGYIGHKDY